MQITTDLLEFMVLLSLSQDDLYGYLLTQKIQEKIAISESTLYPVLRRLQSKNNLTTYDSNYCGRNRRYYKITKEGLDYLNGLKKEWYELRETVDNFIREEEQND